MMNPQIWALDTELIKTTLSEQLQFCSFSVNNLPTQEDLASIKTIVTEPLPDLIPWIRDSITMYHGLSVYLFCHKNPKAAVLEAFFAAGVRGCYTEQEQDELLQELQLISDCFVPESLIKTLDPGLIGCLRRFGFITQDPGLSALFESVLRVAKTDATVLISGENGSGKEVIAHIIHGLSKRATQSFSPVHTGAIPENLLEAELFGHVRGAFTSAIKDRKGKFEAADGGTIFLDEISTMPASLQVKLLRVIQFKQFERVGDNQTVRADVRIISATSQDLMQLVKSGHFREDLYYRLNVVPIHIPPLRERSSDIAILSSYFIDSICSRYDIPPKKFSLGAIHILQQYSWPGNIRQLENIVERMVVLNPEVTVFMPRHIPEEVTACITKVPQQMLEIGDQFNDADLSLPQLMKSIEKSLILRSLQKTKWNKQQAAKLLKINRTTLIEKMKRLEEGDDNMIHEE